MATEKRLIDVTDDNIKAILEKVPYYPDEIWKFTAMTNRFPTVDAVEVVRCKDCKHWHEETGWCNHHSHFIGAKGEACHPWESHEWKMLNAEDFCSYGERRTDET